MRVFLVGTRLSVKYTTVELILTRSKAFLNDKLRKSLIANKDLYWFYNYLPEPPDLNRAGLAAIVEPMSDSDNRWWSDDEVQRHLVMMKEPHSEMVKSLARHEKYAYRTFFRRRREGEQRAEVRKDDLSGCLRTAVGGSGKQFLIRTGRDTIKMRVMTPREYARLQGVPDHYPISTNGIQALTGFGDAVCVPAISWIAQHVLNPLAEAGGQHYHQRLPVAQPFLLDHGR